MTIKYFEFKNMENAGFAFEGKNYNKEEKTIEINPSVENMVDAMHRTNFWKAETLTFITKCAEKFKSIASMEVFLSKNSDKRADPRVADVLNGIEKFIEIGKKLGIK